MKSAMFAMLASTATASTCSDAFSSAGISDRFAETVAHAVHSLTVEDLKMFNPSVTEDNIVPTVPRDLTLVDGRAPEISHSAPSVPLPEGFSTDAMRTLDGVLAGLGEGNDGLGDIWSNLERVVHMFHMKDLWSRINDATPSVVANITETDMAAVCPCITDSATNGIDDKVTWIANEYTKWMPISLHEWGTKIPRLEDKETWAIWKKRLTFYYDDAAIRDAAVYLHCALNVE